jgi:hypothetical protein
MNTQSTQRNQTMVENRMRPYSSSNEDPFGSQLRAAIRHYPREHGVIADRRRWLQGALLQQTTGATTHLCLHAARPSPDHLQVNQIATLRLTGRTHHVRPGDKSR